jgi:PKD repeat protein
MTKWVLILLFVCSSIIGLSQTATHTEALIDFAKEKSKDYEKKKAEAIEWANRNGYPVTAEYNGSFIEIQRISVSGIPQYFITDNAVAAATISTSEVYPGASAGLSLTGSGITVREWDAGSALTSHQEFGGRVTNVNGVSTHWHSTHVAGTIIAAGIVESAKGMAYQANLRSLDWNNDVAELASEGADGALMSCHSYGYSRGWFWTGLSWAWAGDPAISTEEDYLFGFYDTYAQQYDQVARNAPYFLICKSAGNDRNDIGNGTYPPDGPYDCIGQNGVAKNILTVGAVFDIPEGYTNPSSVVMSSFSSWGPADDGRIKPDIVANGTNVYSTYNTNNTSYATLGGTSMSTPSVAGSLALLQQHWNTLTGTYMLAATLKALVLHTADEAGSYPGPDYQFGWGLMNTKNAALQISADQSLDVISELILNDGNTFTREVIASGTEPLKVTIVWTDVPGTPVSPQLDPITPMLVNDLDLRITKSGITYYPWKLDRDNPTNAATNTTKNYVDNVEVVFIANPNPGEAYTIVIDHEGPLSGGSQAFSMIISGITIAEPPLADFLADTTTCGIGQTINFSDLSVNIPTEWTWSFTPSTVTFVEGTDSLSQHPRVQFNTPGSYTVELIVANTAGSDTATKADYISVIYPPVADFTVDTTSIILGDSITFTDLSTHNSTTWSWVFIPATVTYLGETDSISQNPIVQFDAAGFYTVELVVTNASGSDTLLREDYIKVTAPPISDFSTDSTTCGLNYKVTFNDLSLNQPTEWTWSFTPSTVTFVEGTDSLSQHPRVQFNTPGSYSVELIVANTAGSDTATKEDYISVIYPPVADFTADTTSIILGDSITFTDLSTHNPSAWSWVFIPGTVTYLGGTDSISQNPIVQFDAAGFYTVELVVTNASGSDTLLREDYIIVTAPPISDFSADSTTCGLGYKVTFNDLSLNQPTEWIWSFTPSTVTFVEGTDSLSQHPRVQFNTPGSYSVELIVANTAGTDTATKADYISVIYPPVADFTVDTTSIVLGDSITFTDLSTHNPTTWSWVFIPATVTYLGETDSISQNPIVQFDAAGFYTVELVVTNASGSDTLLREDYIKVTAPPISDFSADSVTCGIGHRVTFNDLSLNQPTEWTWSFTPYTVTFVEGTDSLSQHPRVQFNTPGSYSVELIVANTAGTDTATKADYISVIYPPVADFTVDTTSIILGDSITFTDLSTHNPTAWSWVFIPGTVTYLGGTDFISQNPIVQFDAAGLYTVELRVTNISGCDTIIKPGYIEVHNPVIELDITVYLEGPFNGTDMATNLIDVMPLDQPYNISPWNYTGAESVEAIPNPQIVDWILVELRDAADAASANSGTMIARQAAFLLSNGKVIGMDGTSTLQFNNSLNHQLFIVIWHRNHLGIMSSGFLVKSSGIYTYDFSAGASQVYGGSDAHKQIGPGIWGMIGGDGDRDSVVTATDKSIWEFQVGKKGYLESDYNLDSQSDNKDKNDIRSPNLGAACHVLD